MRLLILISFLSSTIILNAQFVNYLAPAESEATAALVVSELRNDTLGQRALSHFGLGFRTTASIGRLWFLRGGARFATRGYNTDEYNGRLRNRYVDAEMNLMREILPSFRLEFGLAGHLLFNSVWSYNSAETGFQRLTRRTTNWNSYMDVFAGIEIRMERNLSLGARYYPTLNDRHKSSLMVQIAVSLDEPLLKNTRAIEKSEADDEIFRLRNGVLLVRIKTLDASIEALKRMGEPLRAKETRKKIDDQNRDLMEAFEKEFNFCPVYYFYSTDTREILSGNMECLMDADGNEVKLDFPYSKVYFADTGPLQADTSTHFYNYELVKDGDFSNKRVKRKYAGQAMGFGALVIKNDRFINLRKPLPYYVKTWGHFFFLRKPDKFVALLNEKLFAYYAKAKGR